MKLQDSIDDALNAIRYVENRIAELHADPDLPDLAASVDHYQRELRFWKGELADLKAEEDYYRQLDARTESR